jgi:hypothetical protein
MSISVTNFMHYYNVSSYSNVRPKTGHKRPEGENRCSSTLSLTSALDGGECLTPRPGRFTFMGKNPVPILWEAGWTPGSVGTNAENLAPTGIFFLSVCAFIRTCLFCLHSPGFCLFVLTVQNTQHKHPCTWRNSNPQP